VPKKLRLTKNLLKMPGAFIEGIELIRQSADSDSNSFPIRLRRNGRERPVIFRAGDFSKAAALQPTPHFLHFVIPAIFRPGSCRRRESAILSIEFAFFFTGHPLTPHLSCPRSSVGHLFSRAAGESQVLFAPFFKKKVPKKPRLTKNLLKMPGAFIEGIELIRQSADSDSNSFPIRLRRNGRERPVIFRAGDFSNAAGETGEGCMECPPGKCLTPAGRHLIGRRSPRSPEAARSSRRSACRFS